MNSIIIGFSRPSGWFAPFSWLIRLVQGWTPYSHVYIKYFNIYANRWEIFQASGLKVNYIGQTLFDTEEVIYKEFTIPISDVAKLKTIQFAIDECGNPYGVTQILGIGWVLFMRIFGKKAKNPFYSSSSFFCSELVGDVLIEIGASDNIDPSTYDPKDILLYLESKNYSSGP